jgi:hypothetical protein
MRSVTLRGFFLLGVWLAVSQHALATCYNPGDVCKWTKNGAGFRVPDASCTKLPTSLYIVNSDASTNDVGYTGGSGLCGFDYNKHEACGDYKLSSQVCGVGAPSTGSPFPGGDPCDPASPGFDPWNCPGSGGPYDDLTTLSAKADAVVQHLKSVAQQSLPPHVDKAVEALGKASSLHLRARITVTSENTSNQPVAGIYEYWEKDGKYRMHFGIDVAEAPVSDLAYDGRQYQIGLSRDSTLSVAYADERAVPSGIPNPLFLVLQPLSVATPDCLGCVLRLSDLRTLRDLRHAVAVGRPALAPLDTFGSDVKITLSAGNLASSVLSQGQGERVERAEFSDYRVVEGTDMALPRSVRFLRTVSSEGSILHVTIQYQIDNLELGREIDDSVFTLNRSLFDRIWSSDRQQFIKATYCPSRQPAQ